MIESDLAIAHRAADQMLAFEAWVVSPECMTGQVFEGETAWSILDAAARWDMGRWVRLANKTIVDRGAAPGVFGDSVPDQRAESEGVMSTIRWLLDQYPRTVYLWVGLLCGTAVAVIAQYVTVAILALVRMP